MRVITGKKGLNAVLKDGDLQVFYHEDEAPGAMPNGTRVRKQNSEAGDAHNDGSIGVVKGSIGPHPFRGAPHYMYFVAWDDEPGAGVPIGVIDTKLDKLDHEA